MRFRPIDAAQKLRELDEKLLLRQQLFVAYFPGGKRKRLSRIEERILDFGTELISRMNRDSVDAKVFSYRDAARFWEPEQFAKAGAHKRRGMVDEVRNLQNHITLITTHGRGDGVLCLIPITKRGLKQDPSWFQSVTVEQEGELRPFIYPCPNNKQAGFLACRTVNGLVAAAYMKRSKEVIDGRQRVIVERKNNLHEARLMGVEAQKLMTKTFPSLYE